jgi:uncharacterized protein YeaO (DUF488 family)
MVKVKRAYETPVQGDGERFLVDRLWPRGVKKEALHLSGWLKDLAPSDELRRSFCHDPEKWDEFRRRYVGELQAKSNLWEPLVARAARHQITLLYAARDEEHNNAVVLKRFLETQAHRRVGR